MRSSAPAIPNGRCASPRRVSSPIAPACAIAATGPLPAWPRDGATRARADFRALVSLLDRDPGLIPPPPCISPRTLAGYWPLERDDLHLIYFNYGILLSELDRPPEARDMFLRARRVRPGPGDVWVFRTDPPIVAVGPPAGSGERECAPSSPRD